MSEHVHAELLRAIADGREIEFLDNYGCWSKACHSNVLGALATRPATGAPKFRVKPSTITVNGIEVPEPLRVVPGVGATYWFVSAFRGAVKMRYTVDEGDHHALKSGLCHATEEAARAHFEAIISTSKQP